MRPSLAHKAVQYAIHTGKIQRGPCEVCGEAKSNGHHIDYDEPLNVMWLCRSHHMQWHKKNGHLVVNRDKEDFIVDGVKLRETERDLVQQAADLTGKARHAFMKSAILRAAKARLRR